MPCRAETRTSSTHAQTAHATARTRRTPTRHSHITTRVTAHRTKMAQNSKAKLCTFNETVSAGVTRRCVWPRVFTLYFTDTQNTLKNGAASPNGRDNTTLYIESVLSLYYKRAWHALGILEGDGAEQAAGMIPSTLKKTIVDAGSWLDHSLQAAPAAGAHATRWTPRDNS